MHKSNGARSLLNREIGQPINRRIDPGIVRILAEKKHIDLLKELARLEFQYNKADLTSSEKRRLGLAITRASAELDAIEFGKKKVE